MIHPAQSRRLIALLLLAVLVLALSPVRGGHHRMAGPQAAAQGLIEVCGVDGVQWVDTQGNPADASSAPDSGHAEHQGDCPWCRHSVLVTQWPQLPAVHVLPVAAVRVPTARADPLARTAWLRLPAQGPPRSVSLT